MKSDEQHRRGSSGHATPWLPHGTLLVLRWPYVVVVQSEWHILKQASDGLRKSMVVEPG